LIRLRRAGEDTQSIGYEGGDQVSVIMTLRVSGDPHKLVQLAQENQDMIRGISQRATDHGLIAHRFYGSEGQIMVVDEWPDPESFHRFFEAEQATIGPMMEQVATSDPEITFWRKLETGDDIGWE
jgi:quinol monooxygenase YgiN